MKTLSDLFPRPDAPRNRAERRARARRLGLNKPDRLRARPTRTTKPGRPGLRLREVEDKTKPQLQEMMTKRGLPFNTKTTRHQMIQVLTRGRR